MSSSSSFSTLHCFNSKTMCLNFVKNSFKVSKLEGRRDINSFSSLYTLKSSYFPYSVSNLSHISFRFFNPVRWKRRSQEIERHKNLNASSFLFKNIALSIIEAGSSSVSIVTLYSPLARSWISMSPFHDWKLNEVKSSTEDAISNY